MKKNAIPTPAASPRTTTLYAFGGDMSTQLDPPEPVSTAPKDASRLSPPKMSRSSSYSMPFEKLERLSSARRDRKSIAIPSVTPPLQPFGHKVSLSASFHSPVKQPT